MTLTDHINSAARRVPAWPIYILGAAWAAWLFYLGATGGLGVEPITALQRSYGRLALQLIILGLTITPLRKYCGVNLLKFRRAIGVTAFFFVLAHLLVWAVLDVQSLSRVWADIAKRPYVTIGMAGFAVLLPLALTSNNWSVRKLGSAAWRRLHKLTYAASLLGAVHFIWLVKGFQIRPLVYFAIILFLLALRTQQQQRRRVAG